jgi:hypothetical protein
LAAREGSVRITPTTEPRAKAMIQEQSAVATVQASPESSMSA